MNLLPWRQTLFQQKSRAMLAKTSIAAGICLLLWAILQGVHHQLQQQVANQQTQLQQLRTTAGTLTQQVTKLRSQIIPREKQQPMPTEQVLQTIQLLSQLPLTQGEIQHFQLQPNQFSLQGFAADQAEFEPLQAYLAQYFPKIRLTEFSPQQNGALQFHFTQGGVQ